MRIAIIGDIHANAAALYGALRTVDSRGYDALVLMGDLLTYGTQIEATLSLVAARLQSPTTTLLLGNHDALYRDLLVGTSRYVDGLPSWIRESVNWTLDLLPLDLWREMRFLDEVEFGTIWYGHANPFGHEDWRYVNSWADHAHAAACLSRRGYCVGIIAHTHRERWYRAGHDYDAFVGNESLLGVFDANAVHVFNPGSVGQPRTTRAKRVSVAMVTDKFAEGGPVVVERIPFDYDFDDYRKAVTVSGLSEATKARILSYF